MLSMSSCKNASVCHTPPGRHTHHGAVSAHHTRLAHQSLLWVAMVPSTWVDFAGAPAVPQASACNTGAHTTTAAVGKDIANTSSFTGNNCFSPAV
mgnify:CR=1 FL=1